jgi:hypothetical protein
VERVAVPMTPGVRLRLFSAARKPASTVTAVSLPEREGIVAIGVPLVEADAEADGEDDVVEEVEQAASEKASSPEAAMAIETFLKLRMR